MSSARDSDSSLTVTMSSTYSEIARNGTSPGQPTAIPSAIVLIALQRDRVPCGERRSGRPRRPPPGPPPPARVGLSGLDRGRDARDEAASAGRHEDGLGVRGLLEDLEAARALAGRRCRRGRRGGSAPPRSPRRRPWRARAPSSTVFPSKTTSAPYPRVAFSFGIGAPTGMKTVDLIPSSPAARATPWAWLPALAATTPAARSSSESRDIRR